MNMSNNNAKSRRNRKTNIVRDIALKTIERDIHNDNKNATITTKQMRVVLRRDFASQFEHARNNAWTFSRDEYDIVRARFDANYRAKIERAQKRATSSRKRATKNANVETSNENA